MANDKQLHRLQFDEFGDKFYVAKITGSATMKHLTFVEGGDRIYKGEGTLTFSCLYPYLQEEVVVINQESFKIENNGAVTIFPKIILTNLQNIGSTIIFSVNGKEQGRFEVP
jgi:phage-related protein